MLTKLEFQAVASELLKAVAAVLKVVDADRDVVVYAPAELIEVMTDNVAPSVTLTLVAPLVDTEAEEAMPMENELDQTEANLVLLAPTSRL